MANFAWKIDFFKLPEKIKIFRKFALKNRIFSDPDPQPPRFQTRLTPLFHLYLLFIIYCYLRNIYIAPFRRERLRFVGSLFSRSSEMSLGTNILAKQSIVS